MIHWVDALVIGAYMVLMLSVGFYFMRRNRGGDDYFVGGRNMGALHVGMSVVATDVGGGFSIGLGGLGFAMGLSGSWMLFTGFLGAWLAAVFLIPRIRANPKFDAAFTFPDLFRAYYGPRVALVGGVISALGYAGFTSSQLLAGAKLAHGTFPGISLQNALFLMGAVAIIYTVMGGIKAVIYTDSIQWAVLLLGLGLVALPVAYFAVGGISGVRDSVQPGFLSLTHLTWQDMVNWTVTILPIWFVGMTLYQRIYACRDVKTAQRAWYVAGLLEWPIMAFLGVTMGLLARVAADQGLFAALDITDPSHMDPEVGLPMLLRTVLPVGLMGVVVSAYFSAILSTADSCLMASSGNVVSDVIGHFKAMNPDSPSFVRFSQVFTLGIGLLALLIASNMTNVLDLMLYSYAFMVSGLFVPTLGAVFWRRATAAGAMAAMVVGGSLTVALELAFDTLPLALDANVFGMSASAVVFVAVSLAFPVNASSSAISKGRPS